MANYCSNSIAFYGNDLDTLEYIRKLLDDECASVRDFVLRCGYPKEEAVTFTDGRDTFVYIFEQVAKDDISYYFIVQTESAWNPHVEVFSKVIKERYDNQIGFVHCSEEPGFEIYVNTDADGRFFSDRYHMDYCINDEYVMEYYSTFKEVIDVLTEKFSEIRFSIYDSVAEINDKVQKLLMDGNDDYFNLYEYSEE